METKSLLMGIMVLKLQEHRMENGDMNAELHHVTVLEEAHNLLRRTSDVQTQESSNLQGKSVEMIANAIAEMRTYGEGFIIADQAPGLMDPAVIRNTNTKIIMRLPDESDRELVGKAASLNARNRRGACTWSATTSRPTPASTSKRGGWISSSTRTFPPRPPVPSKSSRIRCARAKPRART